MFAQQSERNMVVIEPFAHSGFGSLYCCAVKHADFQESRITMSWDSGSANKLQSMPD